MLRIDASSLSKSINKSLGEKGNPNIKAGISVGCRDEKGVIRICQIFLEKKTTKKNPMKFKNGTPDN